MYIFFDEHFCSTFTASSWLTVDASVTAQDSSQRDSKTRVTVDGY